MEILKWHSKFSTDVSLKYNAESTVKMYKFCVYHFLCHFKTEKEPKAIPTQAIKEYLLTFGTLNTRKQHLCAVKCFYQITVGMPNKIEKIPYPKKEKKLPKVIEKDFLVRKITGINNLKHRSIISLGFSVGLRVSEVINLKISDIDSSRMLIHVRNAKGGKDRFVPLSETILTLLRDYYRAYRPKGYLFNGQSSEQYTATSCNKIVKRYLGDEYHFHLLRHSCFTAMLESGTDLRVIQKVAGHNSSKTTEIYTHVSTQLLSTINTPI